MKKILLAIFFFMILPKPALAIFGPRSFITEYVLVDYHSNGSIDTTNLFLPCNSNPCRYGVVEVSVPNNDDILQQVRINLSSTANTNLKSNVAYKNFLTSYPIANSKQKLFLNTTQTDFAEYYNITNSNVAPTISLSLTVKNLNGGEDLFDDDNLLTSNNTLNFTLNASNSGTFDLNNSKIIIQFKKDTFGLADVVNITNPVCTKGSCSREDSDSDGYFDRIVWDINLTQSSSATVQFNGTITSGINFPDTDTSINLDLDDKGVTANYSKNLTFTGITIVKKFAKSAVNQGVDMVQNSTSGKWLVRGYITNAANSNVGSGEYTLAYNVTAWRLYEINETTGEPLRNVQNGTFNSAIIAPNDILYTTDPKSSNANWYDSGSITKPFYGSYFEWEVIWNSTNSENYLAFSNSTLDLPTLYKIDMLNEKLLLGSMLSNTPGDVITIIDTVRHTGSDKLPTDFIQILSVVPVNTTTNDFHGRFDIKDASVKFYFDNTTLGGSTYELVAGACAKINITNPANDGSYDGLVNLTITNLTCVSFVTGGVVGHGLRPNEKIKLVFDILDSESMIVGDTYNFTGNSTLKTQSGTPLTEYHPSQTISVTAVPPSIAPAAPPEIGALFVGETYTIPCIYENKFVNISINQSNTLKIQEISILARTTKCTNTKITIKETSLPFGISAPISKDSGSVLIYLDISKINIQDKDIAKVKIKFKVDKSWINSNIIDVDTINLQRFDGGWEKLPISKIGEDDIYIYFEAESNKLSLFAITGEKRVLVLEYPKYLKLNRGQSALIQILVRNDGHFSLNNLVLFASDTGLVLNITPTILDVLSPKSSFIFLISVKVPKEAPTGIYPIDFVLASDRIIKKGQIKVEVELQKIEVEVEQTIRNYESLIEKLFTETDKATKEGKNTSLVIKSLSQAKSKLEIAKQYYDSQDYEKAKEQLEIIRALIEQAIVQLAKTVGPKIIFIPIPIPRPEIIVSITGSIGLSAYFYYRKRKEDESYRKSIREAIQIIKDREKKKWEAPS